MKKIVKGVSVLAVLATINPATIVSAATTTDQPQSDVVQSANETATNTKPTSQTHHLSDFYAENPQVDHMLAQGCVGRLSLYLYSNEKTQYLTNTYIVVPKGFTIEGGLTGMQASLDQYRKTVKIHNNGTDDGTLSVKQLANTADGKEVYEVVPGEGSYVVQNENTIRTPMVIPIRAALDATGITLNAIGPAQIGNDVLFAGAGDGTNVAYDNNDFYSKVTAQSVGITDPTGTDTYVYGIWSPQRVLSVITASMTDTYNVVDADTQEILATRKSFGDVGTTYSRVGFSDNLGIFGIDVAVYDEKSLTIDRGNLDDTNLTLTPKDPTTGFTDNPYIILEGQTYTLTVKRFGKNVTVEYLDQNGNRIKDANGVDTTDVIKGDIGDDYTASPKEIPGYSVTSDPSNQPKTGQFSDKAQTVTYRYAKAGQNVTVKYVDADGKELAPTKTLTGNVGDAVKAEAAKVDGYAVIKNNATDHKQFTDKAQTITYVYAKTGKDVTVKYVDTDGKELAPTKTLTGNAGDAVKAEAAKVDGYTVIKNNATDHKQFTDEAQTITYVYAKTGKDVTVKYVDANGKELAPTKTLTGNVGDAIKTEAADVDGYTVVKTNAKDDDQFTDEAQTITYQYAKIGKAVTINYTDLDGNQLVNSKVLKGNVGDSINSAPIKIDGYRITNSDATKGHQFTNDYQAISYRYARIGQDVTVKYEDIDIDGKQLADPVTLKGDFGDKVDSKALEIDGYVFLTSNASANDIFTDHPQTITYLYVKKGQDVTVKYVDADGNELANSKTLTGLIGDMVNSEAVKVDGYTMIKTNATANDVFTNEAKTITYQYAKIGKNVTVKYVDADGNQLADSVTLKGNVGDKVNTEAAKIDGYAMIKTNATDNDQFTDEAQTITYQYAKIAKAVTVNYQDVAGNQLANPETFTGNVGDPYTAVKKDIAGYTLKTVTGQANGTLGDTAQTVTYVYTKDPVKGANVTVNYQDADGKQIAPSKTLSGNVGAAYQAVQASIDGYTFKQVTDNANGTFTDQAQTVTYVYTKDPVKTGNVTVNYQDETGKQIATPATLTGNVDDSYHAVQKAITGYHFKAVTGAPDGRFTASAQTVTYVYTKDDPTTPIKTANQTVKYVDENGQTIAGTEILTGNIGTPYHTVQKAIAGYQYKTVTGTPNGQFAVNAPVVTYIYTKDAVKAGNITVNYQDVNGNPIAATKTLSGNVGASYQAVQTPIAGYTFKQVNGNPTGTFGTAAQTVTYIYTKNPVQGANVTVNYQDVAGNQIATAKTLSGNVGTAYQAVQASIDGYTFKQAIGNVSGQFSATAQTVTYVYTKNTAKPTKTVVDSNKQSDSQGTKSTTGTNNPGTQQPVQKTAVKQPRQPAKSVTKNKQQLPQTSVAKVNGLLGVIGAMLIAAVGMVFKKRKN